MYPGQIDKEKVLQILKTKMWAAQKTCDRFLDEVAEMKAKGDSNWQDRETNFYRWQGRVDQLLELINLFEMGV